MPRRTQKKRKTLAEIAAGITDEQLAEDTKRYADADRQADLEFEKTFFPHRTRNQDEISGAEVAFDMKRVKQLASDICDEMARELKENPALKDDERFMLKYFAMKNQLSAVVWIFTAPSGGAAALVFPPQISKTAKGLELYEVTNKEADGDE